MINPSDINILIAEDEPDLRDLLAAKFRVFGFNVETAHSGSSAWDKIQQMDDLQIVVTDVRMPDGSGFELLKQCKQRNKTFPKVFVISAFSDIPKHQLYQAGAEGFMTKPFDTKVLLDVIRKSLLSTQDRWRSPNSTPPKATLDLERIGIDDEISAGTFGMGRGGFFIKHTVPASLSDQFLAFKINFQGTILEGTGIVRWLFPDPDETQIETSEYVGIEIAQLFGDSAKNVIDILGEELPQAYIPSPKSIAKDS